MSLTNEQIKSTILGHLNSLSAQAKGFEDYSLHNIMQAFPLFTKEQIVNALDELESEDVIESRRLEFDVFLPKKDKRTEAIVKNLAQRGLLTYSPFVGIFLVLGAAFVLVAFFTPPFSPPQSIVTLSAAYTQGIEVGIIASIIIAIIGGATLQNLLLKYRTNRIVHEETYEGVIRYTKFVGSLFTMLTVGYLVWADLTATVIQAEVIFTILGVSVAIVVGYDQLLNRRRVEAPSANSKS